VHILGGGPVALAASLHAASLGRSVTLHIPILPAANPAEQCKQKVNSIEAVPSGLIALLIELGVQPRELGVDRLLTRRTIAWEAPEPIVSEGPSMAHVDRPNLEAALKRVVLKEPRINTVFTTREQRRFLLTDHVGQVFDATGRRSQTANCRHILRHGPVARTWLHPATLASVQRGFCLVALPHGYVYRIASAQNVLIGWCGDNQLAKMAPAQWLDYLARAGVEDFELEGARFTSKLWYAGRAGRAGVQWGDPCPDAILLGDAAYSRDVLSSQGLALGLTDALYAASARTASEIELWLHNRRLQFITHIKHLCDHITRCRFRHAPFWRHYLIDIELAHAALTKFKDPMRPARLVDGKIFAI
jgi:2-polyprenyl-6-methoxyphenol hydroxylase-like FAD-dependent oxidoreductase